MMSAELLVECQSVISGNSLTTSRTCPRLETDTRAYFSGVTILISLPTATKIFNWLSTYLGNPLHFLFLLAGTSFGSLSTSRQNLCHYLFYNGNIFWFQSIVGLLFLLMFTIGGSTGIILGNAAVDLGLHDTYYVCLLYTSPSPRD